MIILPNYLEDLVQHFLVLGMVQLQNKKTVPTPKELSQLSHRWGQLHSGRWCPKGRKKVLEKLTKKVIELHELDKYVDVLLLIDLQIAFKTCHVCEK